VLSAVQRKSQGPGDAILMSARALLTSQSASTDGVVTTVDQLLMASSNNNIIKNGRPILTDKAILVGNGDNVVTVGTLITGFLRTINQLPDVVQRVDQAGAVHVVGLPVDSSYSKTLLTFFGKMILANEKPLFPVPNSDIILLSNLTVFEHIDMLNNRLTIGEILIQKNKGIDFSDALIGNLDAVDGFDIAKQSDFNFDEAHSTMVLPLTGTIDLRHFSAFQEWTLWNHRHDWELVRLRSLYDKTNGQFSFYSLNSAFYRAHVSFFF
jgi:hypothetical protein